MMETSTLGFLELTLPVPVSWIWSQVKPGVLTIVTSRSSSQGGWSGSFWPMLTHGCLMRSGPGPSYHGVQHYSQAPHVHRRAAVALPQQEFRGSIRVSAADRVQLDSAITLVAEAKVSTCVPVRMCQANFTSPKVPSPMEAMLPEAMASRASSKMPLMTAATWMQLEIIK
ncbi:uncharacterized protein LOC103008269 isoform X2 [Balaenoptera acutorostrata]|uniref:Uncharacterized protein LOC103008269 isoform X2 n=1 Tax=Balaenoptera acutorostrata TaxID=9767 RepID=A0ABM3TJI7_BALAC|nr:uncharacterized protein LOC103008269 isoform X2 [Balaenoptera acutorostrata]